MNEYPIQSFIDLVSFDQTTYALEDEIQRIEQEITNLDRSKQELQTDLDLVKKAVHDARKVVDGAELQMKDLEQQERAEKGKLDQVTNQKEYKSVLKEISTLKKQQHDYEETLLVAWNKLEVVKKEYELRQVECKQKLVDVQNKLEEKGEKAATLQKDLSGREGQREVCTKNIPAEWLEKYVLMRSRVEDPVVAVIGQNCSACFYNLPPQDFLELKRKRMLQCKGCYRFLYIEQQQEQEQPVKQPSDEQ